MLTADLVRARVYKGQVRVQYLDRDDEEARVLAETLIDTFRAATGAPRRELDDELKGLLGAGTEFLLHRGLAKLLLDRCQFETAGDRDPEELRHAVFSAAARARRDADREGFDRAAALAAAAQELSLPEEVVERDLFGDLKDEQRLTAFDDCEPSWLIDRYNLALAQAVLLRANWMEIELPPQPPATLRAMFRQLKFHQLLYTLEGDASDGYRLRLDGPLSLHRSTQRYGLQMARFLPALVEVDGFTLTASVQFGRKRADRELVITAGDGLRPARLTPRSWLPDEVLALRERFLALESDWDLSEDAEVLEPASGQVLIPDCVFVHRDQGTRVYMEFLGYWRRAPLADRVAALKKHGPRNYILAVGKGLNADKEAAGEVDGPVYHFRATPIATQVLARLKRFL